VPICAAAAVVVAIVGALVVPRLVSTTGVATGERNVTTPPGASGPPAFYAEAEDTACREGSTCIAVRATTTGRW
jgi:hypothetical protein